MCPIYHIFRKNQWFTPDSGRRRGPLDDNSGVGVKAAGNIRAWCSLNPAPARSKSQPDQSVSGAGLLGKILLELAFHALEILRVGRGFLLLGDVRPALGVFGIHLEPLLQPRFGVWLDGVGGTFGFAYAAVDAFVRMDDQHVLTLVEAVDGADFNAVGIFAFDAGFSDDVSHPGLRRGSVFRGLRSA